jgi:hypothetical protein
MGLHVMLISQDPDLATGLATCDELEQLTVVDSADALAGPAGAQVDAVVVDLPAESRRAACERVRQRYPGPLVVPVDDGGEVAGWPPDPARRVLVRPFPVAELVTRLEPTSMSSHEQAAAARRQVRLRPLGLIRPSWAELAGPAARALEAERPGGADPAAAGPAPERLSVDQSLWHPPVLPAPAGRADPGGRQAAADHRDAPEDRTRAATGRDGTTWELPSPAGRLVAAAGGRRAALRLALAAAVVVTMLLAGFLVGANAAGGRPNPVTATTPPSTAVPTTTADGPPPESQACLDALDDADAAISYLAGRVDDGRLSKALRQYKEHRRICLGAG